MPLYTTPVLNINLKKLAENYQFLKKLSMPAYPAAVVKDDAYGLGAIQVVKVLYETGCCNFFVAHALEGAKIRSVAKEAAIFVLQGIGQDSLRYYKKANLIPVISSPEMLKFWNSHNMNGITPAIQVETGLNRLGFTKKELESLSDAERKSFCYVLSHLACADEKAHAMNDYQLQNFTEIKNKFFPKTPGTLAASDGVFLGGDYTFDMTRLGAAMYGINTAPYRDNQMKNIIELKAPVIQVKDLSKGEFVGYSATFRAPKNMKTAIISIGYGDGIPRSLSNRGKVLVKHKGETFFCPIIGRVSMDNVICDISNAPFVKTGDWAWLINDEYTVDDIARDSGTIAYEILSNLGKNPRFIKKYITK